MAYIINETCLACAACEAGCPNKAIRENSPYYEIDFDKCTECVGFHDSPMCAEVCPVDAPSPDPNHSETRTQLIQKLERLYPDKEFVL